MAELLARVREGWSMLVRQRLVGLVVGVYLMAEVGRPNSRMVSLDRRVRRWRSTLSMCHMDWLER